MILPWYSKCAAILALCGALWAHGWVKGAASGQASASRAHIVELNAQLAEVQRLARKKDEITVVWLDRVKVVEGNARTVVKEITKYVTAKADAACAVPVGFVRLWDYSAGVPAPLYQPASGVDDSTPDVALSDVGRGVVEARRRFEINLAQIAMCQQYVKELSHGP